MSVSSRILPLHADWRKMAVSQNGLRKASASEGFENSKNSKASKKKKSGAIKSGRDEMVNSEGKNFVLIEGRFASPSISREGVLARRVEVRTAQGRETLDVECQKGDFSRLFRSLRVGEKVRIEGSLRRRFWRAGSSIASRTFIEVSALLHQPASRAKKR